MSHPAWIGNWTQPPGMVGSNGTAGFSSRRMPCILLLEKPVLVVVWLQCNIGLRHSAFGVGGLAEDTPSAPTEPRTCTWGEGVAYATKATHSPQRRACCKATFLFGTMMRRKQRAAHSGVRDAEQRHSPAFGCNAAMRSPQRRAHRRATKWCKETKFFRIRKQQTQYATHSGVRTAEQRKSSAFGCDEGNTQPTAACALQRDETSSAFGCAERNAQPTAAYALRSNQIAWSMAAPWWYFRCISYIG